MAAGRHPLSRGSCSHVPSQHLSLARSSRVPARAEPPSTQQILEPMHGPQGSKKEPPQSTKYSAIICINALKTGAALSV